MRLIDDWRLAWRFWSVRLNLIGLLFLSAEPALQLWQMVPAESRFPLPAWVRIGLPLLCFGLALVARIIRQKKIDDARARS